jgi:hypothetical protein
MNSTDPEANTPLFQLTLPSDPALALTVRTFVAASGRLLQLDEDRCEDLRLAASELFAIATETDVGEVTLTMDAEGSLTLEGIDDLDGASSDLLIRRGDLLRALFPGIQQRGSTVVIGQSAEGRS